MSDKIDLKKQLKTLYLPAKTPHLIEVPSMPFLMLDGEGDPNNSPLYQQTVSALFQFSYALKFAVKKAQGDDYAVMPLEGLWWADDMSSFTVYNKSAWKWTMMIMQPEAFVTPELVEQIRPQVYKKSGSDLVKQVRYQYYAEGLSVQMLHIGPYMAEAPNIAAMHAFAEGQGYARRNKHHEIYLNDVNKTAPERLQTVLRQPVCKE
jgi:hypothetical protein